MTRVLKFYEPEQPERELELAGLPLASFRRRFAAFMLDFAIVATIFMLTISLLAPVLYKLGWVDPSEDINLSFRFGNWYSAIFIVLYFSLANYFGSGRTFGKWVFKMRVLSLTRERMGFWNCVERALGYGASALELGLGFLQVLWKPDRRATHDRIAETIVVWEPKKLQ